jgi:serralysin
LLRPLRNVDTDAYLAANPDVDAANINPLAHYLANGVYEGRTTFDVAAV